MELVVIMGCAILIGTAIAFRIVVSQSKRFARWSQSQRAEGQGYLAVYNALRPEILNTLEGE